MRKIKSEARNIVETEAGSIFDARREQTRRNVSVIGRAAPSYVNDAVYHASMRKRSSGSRRNANAWRTADNSGCDRRVRRHVQGRCGTYVPAKTAAVPLRTYATATNKERSCENCAEHAIGGKLHGSTCAPHDGPIILSLNKMRMTPQGFHTALSAEPAPLAANPLLLPPDKLVVL
jgi:hypothetical protein